MAANTLAPAGFQTDKLYGSSAPNYGMTASYPITYNYGTKIANGDPVYLYTDGTLRLVAVGGTTVVGVFRGCKYLDPVLGRIQWYPQWSAPSGLASTTVVTAFIDSDPNMTYICQARGSALTQSAIGQNIDIYTGTSGVPDASGYSTCALDAGNVHTTATLPFRIISIVAAPYGSSTYNPTNDNQYLRVQMNTFSGPAGTRTGQA